MRGRQEVQRQQVSERGAVLVEHRRAAGDCEYEGGHDRGDEWGR